MRYTVRFIFVSSILLSLLIFVKILFTLTIESYQIILLGAALSVSLLTYLMLNPPMIKAEGLGQKADDERKLPDDFLNESDFLLIIPRNNTKGRNFSKNNWGLFWINILEKEIGCFSAIDVSLMDREAIKDKRVIIFSKGTTAKLSRETKNILKGFCENGGIVLLEMPDPSISELTGVVLSDKSGAGGRIDWIEPELLSAISRKPNAFFSMPLNTNIHAVKHKESDVKTILKMDGRDAVLERKVKNGKLVMLCFDLSLQIISMKQGIPTTDDYRVSIGLNKNIRAVQTSDMAINKEMKRNLIPFADIFERLIIDIILRDSNIPIWWYYPNNYKGAAIITFDEDFYGDRLAEIENIRGNRVFSYFIISDSKISAETIEKLVRGDNEIGIHWNRFYIHINRFGLHYVKNKNLKSQINHLKSKIQNPKSKIGCRIHYLRWGNEYAKSFEIMDNANIYLDSSYGPGRGEWGYVFGTGFPFKPLDKDGKPFKLYEFPFHCHEPYGGMEESNFDKLMDESVNAFNTTIVYLFHPYRCKKGDISYRRLIKAMDNMDGKRWVTNLGKYMSFYEARKKSSIKSTRLDNKICIDADAKEDGMCISLRHFQEIKDIQFPFKDITGQASVKTGMLTLPKGRHRIEIFI